jgi:hypothetical protein
VGESVKPIIYTDGIHVVAYVLDDLHDWAEANGVKRCWYEGYNKGHPHYDLPKRRGKELMKGLRRIGPKKLLEISKWSWLFDKM